MEGASEREVEERAAACDVGWLIAAAADDTDAMRATEAYHALVKLGDPALDALHEAASSGDVLVRITAATVLAALDQSEADELLVSELESFDFASLPSPRYFWWSGLADQARRRHLRRAVPALIAALSEGADVTVDAARALAEIGDRAAIEPLISVLEEADPYEVMALADALRKFSDPEGLAAIERWKNRNPKFADLAE